VLWRSAQLTLDRYRGPDAEPPGLSILRPYTGKFSTSTSPESSPFELGTVVLQQIASAIVAPPPSTRLCSAHKACRRLQRSNHK